MSNGGLDVGEHASLAPLDARLKKVLGFSKKTRPSLQLKCQALSTHLKWHNSVFTRKCLPNAGFTPHPTQFDIKNEIFVHNT